MFLLVEEADHVDDGLLAVLGHDLDHRRRLPPAHSPWPRLLTLGQGRCDGLRHERCFLDRRQRCQSAPGACRPPAAAPTWITPPPSIAIRFLMVSRAMIFALVNDRHPVAEQLDLFHIVAGVDDAHARARG